MKTYEVVVTVVVDEYDYNDKDAVIDATTDLLQEAGMEIDDIEAKEI